MMIHKIKMPDGGVYELTNGTAAKWIKELMEYRRLEAEGKLLKLPCKVGDTVYIVGDRVPAIIDEIRITEDNHIMFEFEYDKSYELTEVWDSGGFELEDIGKTVFLTREEAEAKLQEVEQK